MNVKTQIKVPSVKKNAIGRFKFVHARFGIPWSQFQGLAHAPRIGRPLLVIHDREDREVPWHEGEALAAAWPGAQMVATEGLGHRRLLLDSDVAATAAGFLASE